MRNRLLAMATPAQAKPRPFLTDALHLTVLTAFAVAQPLLDLLGRKPEFFAVRRSAPVDVVLLLAVLFLVAPLPLIALEAALRLGQAKLQRSLHALFCAALIAATMLPPVGRSLDVGPWPQLGLAMLLGLAGAAAIDRLRPARLLLTYLSLALLIFPAVFLARPGIAKIVLPREVETMAAVTQATTPIVLLVFDELPVTSLLAGPREIDAVRYPSFAALAAEATWYRHAATVSDFTVFAVPAILNGRLPDEPRMPIAPDHPRSLFTLLGGRYAMNVSESVTQLCPASACGEGGPGAGLPARMRSLLGDLRLLYLHLLLPEEWAGRLPPVDQNWMLFADPDDWRSDFKSRVRSDRAGKIERFLDGIRPTDAPVLHMLHATLPHPPFVYLPSGQVYSIEGRVIGIQRDQQADDAWAALQNYQRHLLQVGYVDRLLGRVVDRLKEAGLWDRAVVAVTADHGASFVAGGSRRKVTHRNFARILSVPLLIKAPGQRAGKIDDRPIATIDILPTIAELAGIDLPWPVDGISFADPGVPGRGRITVAPYRRSATPTFDVSPAELAAGEVEALEDLAARFGTGRDGGRELFRIGPEPALIGRQVADLSLGAPTTFGHQLTQTRNVFDFEPGGPVVPAHVTGRLVDAVPSAPVDLAVVVNGRIAATTTTWSFAPAYWSAVVDPAFFRDGINVVELLALAEPGEDDAAAALRPVPATAVAPVFGLVEQGFHELENWPSGPIRWTDGDASVTVPVGRSRPPRQLRLTLAGNGPDGCRLEVRANGVTLLDTRLAPLRRGEPWTTTLDLDRVDLGDRLTVDFESDTFLPGHSGKGPRDPRHLGVAIAGFELLAGD